MTHKIIIFLLAYSSYCLGFEKLKIVNSIDSYNQFEKINQAFLKNAYTINSKFETEEEFLNYNLSAIQWATEYGTNRQEIYAKYYQLEAYGFLKNDAEIIKLCYDLLKYDTINKHKIIVNIYHYLKAYYIAIEHYDEALNILPKYYLFAEKFNYFPHGEHSYACESAYMYFYLKNYKKSIVDSKRCIRSMFEDSEYLSISSSYNNIGLAFEGLRKNDSALFYYNKGIKILEQNFNPSQLNDSTYNGHFKNVINSNKAELRYLKDSIAYNLEPHLYKELKTAKRFNEKNIQTSVYYKLAKLYYKRKNFKKAKQYIDSTLMVLKHYTNSNYKQKTLQLKGKIHLSEGEFTEGNLTFENYKHYRDSIEKDYSEKKFFANIVKYETNEKTKELNVTKRMNKNEKRINFYERSALVVLIVIVTLTFVLYKKIKRSNIIINSQNNQISIALEEKELLLKEIHHRVKNNLQVISGILMTQSKKKSKQFDEVVKQSQQQINAMALVHEMLYKKDNLSSVNLEEYIKKLGLAIISSYPNKKIDYKVQAKTIFLKLNTANPLGLIITELIINSLKHAFLDTDKGEIDIVLTESSITNEIIFTYKDSGSGYQTKENNSGFGNRLLSYLAEEINAKTLIKNSNKGFLYQLTIPKPHTKNASQK